MIADSRPLEPEFVPGDVRHRDHEVNALADGLRPLTEGRRVDPTLLFGPSGTGKTCIARHVADRLRREADVDAQYVNCWEAYTRFKTLYRLLEGLDRAYDVHRQSTPRDALLDRLREERDRPYVAVLDEVDQLEDSGVLYDLWRTRDLALVLIANREEGLFARLDERLVSRLHAATRIRFRRYGTAELVAIVRDRARWGLREGAIDEEGLRTIAEAAAGDARIGIAVLQEAARLAGEREAASITGAVINEAIPEARAEIRQKHVQQLTDHQRVLYDIVMERGRVAPKELYEAYRERVNDPLTRRMVRNHLTKMEQYSLLVADGKSRSRRYMPA